MKKETIAMIFSGLSLAIAIAMVAFIASSAEAKKDSSVTDWLQAIFSCLALVFAGATFWKLMQRDEQRDQQVAELRSLVHAMARIQKNQYRQFAPNLTSGILRVDGSYPNHYGVIDIENSGGTAILKSVTVNLFDNSTGVERRAEVSFITHFPHQIGTGGRLQLKFDYEALSYLDGHFEFEVEGVESMLSYRLKLHLNRNGNAPRCELIECI